MMAKSYCWHAIMQCSSLLAAALTGFAGDEQFQYLLLSCPPSHEYLLYKLVAFKMSEGGRHRKACQDWTGF